MNYTHVLVYDQTTKTLATHRLRRNGQIGRQIHIHTIAPGEVFPLTTPMLSRQSVWFAGTYPGVLIAYVTLANDQGTSRRERLRDMAERALLAMLGLGDRRAN